MAEDTGIQIVRVASLVWEDRVNVDGWPSRAGLYYEDRERELCLRLIHYPVGSTEPRHVHAGTHATTVLKGRAIVDGLTLGPLDVVLGPGGEPHGPLHYPDGCQLFSAFQGSYYHSEVRELSGERNYRLIRSAELPWVARPGGCRVKTLVERGAGRLLLEARSYACGAEIARDADPGFESALVVEGGVEVAAEALGAWDFLRLVEPARHAAIRFPRGATLLALAMRPQ
ncbi:MAG TPA: hypothetical protein VNK67_05765 [Burkholderiales bacterium]|nr:hypothetical protein [Burkholderiales bacterium]